ncbi:MAG TPA: DUF1570 domain-containing protein, partial [Pirellulaceae bacterium]|nr:DUF1570 domain-containing protein [Pirellulaceae bacterium]
PDGERTVATIIHEATHQLAFNSGLQHRRADIPKWCSEGMAIYFETPDLKNSRGWKKVGAVNQLRLLTYRQNLPRRAGDAFTTLLGTDDRFNDPQSAGAAYAEAWALNYFLIRTRQKEYVKYLELLSKKKPCEYDSPDQRLKDFQEAFGDDLSRIETAFLKYMSNVKF